MKKGISLHLGLNYVDPEHYDGWDGELAACEADADDMVKIAKKNGFTPSKLLTKKATAKVVKEAILDAAKKLKSGDTFFMTYSGHGGQVPDTNGDEGTAGDAPDRKDETWCLYDREVVDDELAALYAKFKKGVRVLILSDSCHSGSVTRAVRGRPSGRVRLLPPRKANSVYEKNRGIYDAIQAGVLAAEQQKIKATILLISGCQDRQLSRDGVDNGLFTGTLLEVWNKGKFEGDYRNFRDAIAAEMPHFQIPNYFIYGAPNPEFEGEKPFTVKARPAAKKKATRAARGGPAAAAATAPAAGSAIEFVLSVLKYHAYPGPGGPTPESPLTAWFKRLKKDDEDLSIPGPGRLATIAATINSRLHVGMTPSKMVAGRFPTPQAIANLA